MKSIPIVLASTSPRRIELLKTAGYSLLIQAPLAREDVVPGESPQKMVLRLAYDKAASVCQSIRTELKHYVVIGADTTVVAPNGKEILGKPEDARDAHRMLSKLVGKTHTVLTGYCLIEISKNKVNKKVQRVVSSQVKLRKINSETIARYIATGEPMDKAGAYAAQGLGMSLVEAIEGSYTNVVGLPMSQLIDDLEKKFKLKWIRNA